MIAPIKPLYSPALRMKAGELEGVPRLAPDVADCILPRFIVPPSGERDESAPLLLGLSRTPDISPPLIRAWRRRPALIDSTYILDEFGRERAAEWLPDMFERARKKEAHAIPAALLSDIELAPMPIARRSIAVVRRNLKSSFRQMRWLAKNSGLQ